MNNQINIQKAAVSKEFNRISVFMFVFKTFFKPLEELFILLPLRCLFQLHAFT